MVLSKNNLKHIHSFSVLKPDEKLFELPEKVLQFGTGVLLRGLPDYFIDNANRQGIFNGRIVVVKSTSVSDTEVFNKQDALYTHCIRGIEDGVKKHENIINCAISRVLSASNEWEKILDCALNLNMKLIISNTTEIGIQLVHEDVRRHPPVSFPGKLLAFLYHRYVAFSGCNESGMIIIPTELIPENGKKLKSIVMELARGNGLEDTFIEWLECRNHFCNSLVDRIVPGHSSMELQTLLEKELGYTDNLSLISEAYCLWAIESNEETKKVLTFAGLHKGVILAENIELYRELKLRLLNGSHILACSLAFLAGCETVQQAMEDEILSRYIIDVMKSEIAMGIPYEVDHVVAQKFASQVLDRFRNKEIQHHWINITTHYSLKMKMRVIPVVLKYYELYHHSPELISLGFAAYVFFMKALKEVDGIFYGEVEGNDYVINDDSAGLFMERWKTMPPSELVHVVINDIEFWDADLRSINDFQNSVLQKLEMIIKKGIKETISFVQSHMIFANESQRC